MSTPSNCSHRWVRWPGPLPWQHEYVAYCRDCGIDEPTPSPAKPQAPSETPQDAEQTAHGSDTMYYVNSQRGGKCQRLKDLAQRGG